MKALLLVLFALVLIPAVSQSTRTFWTLEARAGEAANIYRGAIVGVSPDPEPSSPQLGFDWLLEVRVDDTLKGHAVRSLRIRTPDLGLFIEEKTYQAWSRAGTQFLFYQKPTDPKPLPYEWTWLRLGSYPDEPRVYAGNDNGLLTMNFKVLSSAADVVSATKSFCRSHPHSLPTYRLGWVNGAWPAPGPGGIANSLVVPICPELESLARKMINEPESAADFATIRERDPVRAVFVKDSAIRAYATSVGIQALQFFKSTDNERLIKRHLDDSGDSVGIATPRSDKVQDNEVRQAAYLVLTGWGLKIRRPGTAGPAP